MKKKNTFMRLAMVLVLLVLVTTSAVGGTFAKYTTKKDTTDTARVAKWGVVITANDSALVTTEVNGANEDHVVSEASDVVLAPGSQISKLADFSISGTPEVAVNVSYAANLELANWEVDGTEYCPLVFVVNGVEYKISDTVDNLELAVEGAIAALSDNYATPYDLSSVLAPKVLVYWAFEGDDVKDTALGDQAFAGNAATITLTITCTVTQID